MIQLNGISKQYGAQILLDAASAHIGYRTRAALIGPNGAGKSTIIRMILEQEEPDAGIVTRAKNLTIGHLAQEVPKFEGRTVLDEVMRLGGRREEILRVKGELETLLATDESASSDQSVLDRYGKTLEELELMDEYRLESRAREILGGMGFSLEAQDRNLTSFSGGWLMRVALSRALLMSPDLLLLDEPTNHLDLESILWLEQFLRGYPGSIVLVSHDTEFLNRVVHEVIEVDQCKLWMYKGNLEAYAIQKQERMQLLQSQYESQQERIAEIRSFVDRFGAKATKARQAQSRLKELDRMEMIELPDHRKQVRFRFPPATHSGKEVVTLKNLEMTFQTATGTRKIYQGLNHVVTRGSRVAITGINGAGKTVLLKLFSGELTATSGELKYGTGVQMGYYAQHQAESLNLKKTVLEELEWVAPELPVSQVRAIAGAFLFSGDAVEKVCGVLSGGEKARVALAKLLLKPSNVLILDEPTNHLDVASKEVLLQALENYDGTLIVVSHDRGFMSGLVDHILEVVPGRDPSRPSELLPFIGSYDDFVAKKEQQIADSRKTALSQLGEKQKSVTGQAPSDGSTPDLSLSKPKPSNNQLQAWKKEAISCEQKIGKLEERQQKIHVEMGDPALYEDKARLLPLMTEQKNLEEELGKMMARWEELLHLLDEFAG